jgi:trimeric autotransporter adhesin
MNQHASINRIFRLVWSDVLNAYVAAAETTRGRGKRAKRKLIGAALLLSATVAHAGGPATALIGGPSSGPTGGHVTGGSGTISQSGGTTTIAQASENLSLSWQNFNIGAQQTVDFVQPNAAAIAVNRILGNTGSVILGQLNANGQVYLINPNGVLFGKGAEVNVGGLVTSTLNLDDSTLGDASKSFSGKGSGSVVNDGTLTAGAGGGGAIVLLGNHVINNGVISAQLGSVALGAGSAATLRFSGTHLVSMQIDQSVLNSVAANGGLIRADGGQVLMTAGAQKALLASVVNNSGVIEARTLDQHAGTITLLGGMTAGAVEVGGTLDASAPNGGNGGSIDTSAATVKISNGVAVTTAAAMGLSGSWLIDPTDFTISAGTGTQNASGIGASTLQTELAHGNVSIVTSSAGTQNGDIDVNAPVSWSANKLALTAAGDINVNAVMTVSGSAKVDFEPGSGNLLMGFASDGSFAGRVDISSSAANALTIGGQVYTVINALGAQGSTTTTDLQGMNGNLAGYYALGSSLDASATSGWNSGAGFTAIGVSGGSNFTGTFDGLGHTITGLTINLPSGDNQGLFGWIGATGIARNVGLVGGSMYGLAGVGSLAGASYGTISNAYSSAAVTGILDFIGGLVGTNLGKISNSYATGSVIAGAYAGGLVGYSGAAGMISNSYATGLVSAESFGGGLVGANYGAVSHSHATGAVGYGSDSGGLVGQNGGAISNSYATGNVHAGYGNSVGGLVGTNTSAGTISNAHATGTVTGSQENASGGLVGTNAGAVSQSYASGAVSVGGANYQGIDTGGLVGSNTGTITTSYASGAVSAPNTNQMNTGGLVGYNNGGISASYATGTVSGYNNVGGLVGNNDTAGTVSASFASGNATASNVAAGGLVGSNYGAVSSSHATGTVGAGAGAAGTGADAGGLVGANGGQGPGGPITDSYATGAVSAGSNVGGLLGFNNGSISVAFASGAVTGTRNVGGLVGFNNSAGTITDSYATGSVSGSSYVGGLAGASAGLVDRTYATGSVTGGGYSASLVGQSTGQGTITNSFYDISSNPGLPGYFNEVGPGYNAPGALAPLTTAQLQAQANFTSATAANAGVNPAWDFGATWTMYQGHTAPLLQYFMTPLTVSGTLTQTYNGAAFAPTISHLTYSSVPDDSQLFGTVTVAGSAAGALHAGSYSFTPGGLYSDQLGYIISYTSGAVTIAPAPLTVAGTTAGKVYDGTTLAPLSGGRLVGVFSGDTVTLTQAGNFASKSAGSGIAVSVGDSIGGASMGDYVLVEPTGITGTITPALLTVSGTAVGNKVYDGTTVAALSGGSLVGLIGGDTVTLNQSGMFTSAGVGVGIAVNATDSLSGASAGDYSIVEPTGLRGSILPGPGAAEGSGDLVLAAVNARTQIVQNFIYPQLGAEPQVIDASSTIADATAETTADATGSQQAFAITASMTIGANGTLKIENGGLRLPTDAFGGQ